MIAVSGVEADYDGGKITLAEARRRLRKARTAALIYTTPSHSQTEPRWRIFAPLSEEHSPESREQLVARLNGLFDGILDSASFNQSQAYFAGSVRGRPKVRTCLVDGRYLDTAADLDAGAIGKRSKSKPKEQPQADKTGRPLRVLREALFAIQNDGSIAENDDWDWWIGHVAALHFETDGSAEGLEIAHDWSAQWLGYDPDHTEVVWNSFGRGSGPLKTGHSILAEACKLGWHDLERILELFDVLPCDDDEPVRR